VLSPYVMITVIYGIIKQDIEVYLTHYMSNLKFEYLANDACNNNIYSSKGDPTLIESTICEHKEQVD